MVLSAPRPPIGRRGLRVAAAVALGWAGCLVAGATGAEILVEGELVPGETREHSVVLPPEHWVDLAVDQGGLDVAVRLLDDAGTVLAASDVLPAGSGSEYLTAVTGSTSGYRVEVVVHTRDAAPAPFMVRLETARPRIAGDHERVQAEAAYVAGLGAARAGAEGRRAAVDHYRRAATLFAAVDDPQGEAKARHNLGRMLRRLGQNAAAETELQQAIAGWRAAGMPSHEVDSRVALASLLRRRAEPGPARDQLDVAVDLLDRHPDTRRRARVLHARGGLLWDLDHLGPAATDYRHAIALRLELGDARGEANSRNSLGLVLRDLGDYATALFELDRAAALFAVHDPRRLAAPLNNLGALYDALGLFDRARAAYERALEALGTHPDASAEARTHNNLGWSAHFGGRPEAALTHFAAALARLEDAADPRAAAVLASNLARTQATLGHPEEARATLEGALAARRAQGSGIGEARTLIDLAMVDLALGRIDTAAAAAERARLLASRQDAPRVTAFAYRALGRLERARGRHHRALERFRAARDTFVALQARVAFPTWRATLVAGQRVLDDDLIQQLMILHEAEPDSGWAERALAVSEQARSQGLIERLALRDLPPGEHADPAWADRARQLRHRIDRLAAEREQLPAADAATLRGSLADALAQLELTRARLAQAAPRHAALTRPRSPDADALRAMLAPGEALVEIALGAERSTAWLVERKTVTAARLPDGETIRALCARFLAALTGRARRLPGEDLAMRSRRLREQDAEADRLAAQLGRMVLGGFGDQLDARRLAFAVDGPLASVPLALLIHPATGEALFRRHEIVLVPSASAVAALRRAATTPRSPSRGAAIVFGDPVFRADDPRLVATGPAGSRTATRAIDDAQDGAWPAAARDDLGPRLARLPFSRREAEAVARQTGPTTRLLLDFDASRRAAIDGLSGYRFVHFATHGIVDPIHPELSALVLSTRDADGEPLAGHLRLHDIYGLEITAELVVLSACETARGPELAGEGLIGLAHAFMHAGAPRVIASLWPVRDEATAALMAALYDQLVAGAPPAAALRRAQQAVREQPRFAAPYFWAGFVIEGDWS